MSNSKEAASQVGGGNIVGAPKAPKLVKPAPLGGKGFSPDNQATSRGKGKS